MAMSSRSHANVRLQPEVNRILFVRNLPYKINSEHLYDLFGKYGPLRQIRIGTAPDTRGTAFVVYEDIFDAKAAYDHLSGFNILGRYLIVLYYSVNKQIRKKDVDRKKIEINKAKHKYGIE